MTQSPAIAGKKEARHQDHLDAARIDRPGIGPGLQVTEGMALQRLLESMDGQRARLWGPGDRQGQGRVVAESSEIHLAGHRQEREHNPPVETMQHLASRRRNCCRFFGCRRRDGGGDRAPPLFLNGEVCFVDGMFVGHPVTIRAWWLTSKAMRLLQTLLRTILTLSLGVLSTLIAAPVVIVIARINPTSPTIDRIARAWSRLWLAMAGCTLEVTGGELVDHSRSHIVVANHLSVLDIMVCFLAVPVPIRFLAKKELFRIPVLAPAMRAIGIVEVDRSARSAVHAQVNRQARELVASGRSLIIYPEGTRSRDGELRPFKKGAFTMAVAGGVPILPVTIAGSYRAWPPGRFLVFGGRKITAVIDPPIETTGMTREDVTRLTEDTRTIIEKRYLELGGRDA